MLPQLPSQGILRSHMRRIAACLAALVIPFAASARTYDDSRLPYSDAPPDLPARIAISVLTEEGILQGHPDGTFRPGDLLNRAEFLKIAMGLVDWTNVSYELGCFPDIPRGVWYELPVCVAKAMGVVRGNAREGVPPPQWLFEPARPVQYEEAVKILIELYRLPLPPVESGGQWYEPYLLAVELLGVDLTGIPPGHALTRAEMARLTAALFAYSAGELSELRAAEAGVIDVPKSPSSASSPSRSSRAPAPSPPPSSVPAVQLDPDIDASTRPRFLLLGATSHVLGAASVFSEAEPLDVRDLFVVLADAVQSISFFKVYDHDARLLGNAHLDTSLGTKTYRLPLQPQQLVIGKEESFSFYARAVTKSNDSGGVSGEEVQIDMFTVEGDGSWSNRAYSQSTTETFPTFETARSVFTGIANAGPASDALMAGPGQEIAEFEFQGQRGDPSASLEITDLTFRIEQTGTVTLSNVELSAEDASDRHSCSATASEVTCSSIPARFGAVDGDTRLLRLFGDVSIPSGTSSASLRLTLNDAGSVSSAGSITWTDGDTSFSWVPFESPVARGTYFSY